MFNQLATNVLSPRRCGCLLLLVEIRNIYLYQTGSGINLHHCSYRIYRKWWEIRCGPKGGQTGNQQWALDRHHDLWSWMILNHTSSRSLQLHVRYFENGVWDSTALGIPHNVCLVIWVTLLTAQVPVTSHRTAAAYPHCVAQQPEVGRLVTASFSMQSRVGRQHVKSNVADEARTSESRSK